MKITFIGDSLTYGYGVSRTHVWTSIIHSAVYHGCLNKGINGDTTSGMLSRFHGDVIQNKPNFVHIMGGGNDLICDADLGILKSNFMAMTNQARAEKIKPILATVVDIHHEGISDRWKGLSDYKLIQSQMDEFSEWLVKFAEFSGVQLINYRTEMRNYLKGKDMSDYYLDGLHLNEEGNKVLAKIFMDNFVK